MSIGKATIFTGFHMYNNQQSGGISSNLVFGLIIVAVMAIIFIGILIMPSNSGKSGSKIQVGDSVLLSELDDGATRKYIVTLNRVSPRAGKRLEAKAIKAIANGDGKADLAILAMEAMDDELPAYLSSLKKADVKHFDAMLQLSERGLGQLRRSNSKWCKAGHYERFENLSPAAAEELAPVSTATDDVAARIAELENCRTTQLARIESLETTITQLEEAVAAMSTSASASVSEIAGLNAQLAAKDARIVELEAQVAAAASAEEGVPPDP